MKTILITLLFAPFLFNIEAQTFYHPGALHTESDFVRMRNKVTSGKEPWASGYQKLEASQFAQLTFEVVPPEYIFGWYGGTQTSNHELLMYDAAAAYQSALRWKVSGDSAFAEHAIKKLNGWAYTLKDIGGGTTQTFLEGLQGFTLANAAEIMRDYSRWKPEDFNRFKEMLKIHFVLPSLAFLDPVDGRHGTCVTNYGATWGLSSIACGIAAGILMDDRELYNQFLTYYKSGPGNEAIQNLVPILHDENFGQWQESGLDQTHCLFDVGLAASICEMVWNQGEDLYAYDNHRLFKGINYVAAYNLWKDDLPFSRYQNCNNLLHFANNEGGRGMDKPVWEIVYNHYGRRLGWDVTYLEQWANQVRPEGGSGDYMEYNSNFRFHYLGLGTLTQYDAPGNVLYNWQHNDIGWSGVNGKARKSGDSFQVEAMKGTIGGERDEFHYVFQRLIGNGSLTAKIDAPIENSQAKLGIMLRENLSPGSRNFMVGVTPGYHLFVQNRTMANATTNLNVTREFDVYPYFLKVSRYGDTLVAEVSKDSVAWEEMESLVMAFNEQAYIGLAVSGDDSTKTTQYEFSNVYKMQANIAPIPEIISLKSGDSSFVAGKDIRIDARVYDYENNTSTLEFYVNDTMIHTATNRPYTYVWDSVLAGNYALKLRATDSL